MIVQTFVKCLTLHKGGLVTLRILAPYNVNFLKENGDGWDTPLERRALPLRRRLLSGTLRGHEREVDLVALGEEPSKKRQQKLGGPGYTEGLKYEWRALLDALCSH